MFEPILKADNGSEQPETSPAEQSETEPNQAAAGPVDVEEDTTQHENNGLHVDTTAADGEASAAGEGDQTPMTDRHVSDADENADEDAQEIEHPQDNSDIHEPDA